MPRYVGRVGVRQDAVETEPGIYTEGIEEISVQGELRLERLGWRGGELSQDKPRARHVVSLVVSQRLVELMTDVVYVTWAGRKWSVMSIDAKHPRLNLTLGGLYNG